MTTPLTLPAEEAPLETSAEDEDLATTAELAECTCPEWCERDHDRD
jgi:hypothetical protein